MERAGGAVARYSPSHFSSSDLFAVGAPSPDGSDADRGRAFDALLDGRRIRDDLGFSPLFPRLADAVAAGALAATP